MAHPCLYTTRCMSSSQWWRTEEDRRREKLPTESSPHLTSDIMGKGRKVGRSVGWLGGWALCVGYCQLSKQIKIDKFLFKRLQRRRRSQYLFMDCHPIKIVINPSSDLPQFTPIPKCFFRYCHILILQGVIYVYPIDPRISIDLLGAAAAVARNVSHFRCCCSSDWLTE